MSWWSFAEALHTPILTILDTHTEGQLRLMALASHVQYENLKNTTTESKDPPPLKRKSFKDMTQIEVEKYYQEQGF